MNQPEPSHTQIQHDSSFGMIVFFALTGLSVVTILNMIGTFS